MSANQKRAIRKKAVNFRIVNGEILFQNYFHSIPFTSDYSQYYSVRPNRCMPSSIDNYLAIAIDIDVVISSKHRQLHAWTQTIYVLPEPFMFWHKWSGGTEGSPTPQKGCTGFKICRIYPDFTDFKRFH